MFVLAQSRRGTMGIVLFTLLVFVARLSAQAQAASRELRETRHGLVLDHEARPVEGARVTLVGTPLQRYDTPRKLTDRIEVVTGADGRFEARVRPELSYDAWASVDGTELGDERGRAVRLAVRDYENARTHNDVLVLLLLRDEVSSEIVTVEGLDAWARWAPLRFSLRVQGGRSFVLPMRRQRDRWLVPPLPPHFGRQFEILASDGRLIHVQPLSRRAREHVLQLLPPMKLRWRVVGTTSPVDLWRLRGYAQTYEKVAMSTDAHDLEYEVARCKYRGLLWPEEARFAFSSAASKLAWIVCDRDELGTLDEDEIKVGQESSVVDIHVRQAVATTLELRISGREPAQGLTLLYSPNGAADCEPGSFSAPFELHCDAQGRVVLPVSEDEDPAWVIALPRPELRDQLRGERPLAATWIVRRFKKGADAQHEVTPGVLNLAELPRVALRVEDHAGQLLGGAFVDFVTAHKGADFAVSEKIDIRQVEDIDFSNSDWSPRSVTLPYGTELDLIIDSDAPLRSIARWPLGQFAFELEPKSARDGIAKLLVPGVEVLRGRVVDGDDKPLTAMVLVTPPLLESRVLTRADGSFELRVVEDRELRCVVEVPIAGQRRPLTFVEPVPAKKREVVLRPPQR